MSDFELVWDSRCGVAESPVWDASTRRLLFCDIPGKRIHALSVDGGARTTWDFPEVVGSFGLCLSGRLVVALRHHVVLFDPRTRSLEKLTEPVDEPATNRFNDGKVGPDGSFWVGSMDERSPRQKTGALYRVTPQGRVERKSATKTVNIIHVTHRDEVESPFVDWLREAYEWSELAATVKARRARPAAKSTTKKPRVMRKPKKKTGAVAKRAR